MCWEGVNTLCQLLDAIVESEMETDFFEGKSVLEVRNFSTFEKKHSWRCETDERTKLSFVTLALLPPRIAANASFAVAFAECHVFTACNENYRARSCINI